MKVEDYQPSAAVLERLTQVDFVALVGPTAAGKSTIIHAAVAARPQYFKEVIITTSRAPREGERQDVDMHFHSRQDIEAGIRKRQFVQVILHPSGDIYGTLADEYGDATRIALMPVLASALPTFRALPFKRFRAVYVLPPDFGTWTERIKAHGFTTARLAQRFDEAKASLRIALDDPTTQFLISKTAPQAFADLQGLLDGMALSGTANQAGLRDHAACLLAQIY